MEAKRKKFKQLGTSRTNNVLRTIRILGNLSNRHAYDYSEDEVNKIFSEIERGLRDAKTRFRFNKNNEFRL